MAIDPRALIYYVPGRGFDRIVPHRPQDRIQVLIDRELDRIKLENPISGTVTFQSIQADRALFTQMEAISGQFTTATIAQGFFGNTTTTSGNFGTITFGQAFGLSAIAAPSGLIGTANINRGLFNNFVATSGQLSTLTAAQSFFTNLAASSGQIAQLQTNVQRVAVKLVVSNYSLGNGETSIWVDTTTGSVTVTLPLASSVPGQAYEVKRISGGSNTLTIARSGADLIDGDTTLIVLNQWDSPFLRSDGNASWRLV